MKLLMRKSLGDLTPADEHAEAAMRRLKDGAHVSVEMIRQRNPQFHKKYWALLKLVFDNRNDERELLYPSIEDLHAAVKICAGLRTRIELPDGTVGFRAGSIAWNKLSEDDFAAFFTRVCNLVSRYFLPGIADKELADEVGRMIGERT